MLVIHSLFNGHLACRKHVSKQWQNHPRAVTNQRRRALYFLPMKLELLVLRCGKVLLMDLVDRALEALAMDAIDALRVFFLLAAATVCNAFLF